jgi:hypothetical protein
MKPKVLAEKVQLQKTYLTALFPATEFLSRRGSTRKPGETKPRV